MLLRFPSLEAFTLSLTAGVIPAEESVRPVQAAVGNAGELFVVRAEGLSAPLRNLGVKIAEPGDVALEAFDTWLQLVPLVRQSGPLETTDKTVVLFDIEQEGQLAEIVGEVLRLGNDRQSFRQLASEGQRRTLLRVVGPPYYALLRAIEHENVTDKPSRAGKDANPTGSYCRAYYEQRPRVWVQLGYQHPLAARLQPPPGKWMLLRPPRQWQAIDEAPFQDVYSVAEFKFPELQSAWRDEPLGTRFSVPLRLTSSSSTEPAELWVLREEPWQQVEQLVSSSDNELIARLAFAVADVEGHPLVVLRARPSKLAPPVLVLRGSACRSYLKLPNLFVPVSQRLYPPLRRDAVARLLAGDINQIVWLDPGPSGAFTPRSLPDAAFRPLTQWVDYVLDSAHEPLAAWKAAHRFDFESFVCADEVAERPKPPPKQRTEPSDTTKPSTQTSTTLKPTAEEPVLAELVEAQRKLEMLAEVPQPGELQRRLTELERQFLELTTPLDNPQRRGLWREMARLSGCLERPLDATLGWSQFGWDVSLSSGELQSWLQDLRDDPRNFPKSKELHQLADDSQPQRITASRLAVQILNAAQLAQPPAVILDQLELVARALQQQEVVLPVRLTWLAWVALARLAHRDALLLARARDRILERLFQDGLSPERDVPGFLRSGGGHNHERQVVLKNHLASLREQVAEWIQEPPGYPARTRVYADLLFAYGFTSLGEVAEGERIVVWARQQLGTRDALHQWTLKAYEYRIEQIARGLRQASLSPELLKKLEGWDRTERYKADQVRKHSRVIEPFERIDPFRRWHRRYASDFDRDLALLFDERDHGQLAGKLRELLSTPPMEGRTPAGRLRILTAALELSPRLGAEFGAGLLGRVLPAWDAADDTVERAMLLEKGLHIAAHFDQREAVQAFVERFESSLPDIVSSYLSLQSDFSPERQGKLMAIESLFNQSLRGFRKLGLRDEIGRIFGRIVELVQQHEQRPRPAKAKAPAKRDDPTRAAKLLLSVAAGWFHFGQAEQAQPVIEDVRRKLFASDLPVLAKASLACAYVSAVGQAPLEIAWPLLEELFAKRNLDGVRDNFVTNSHFSLSQLDIVEATVLTLVSDVFVLSREAQAWLEEDEFLVRRKIHRDVREMTTG